MSLIQKIAVRLAQALGVSLSEASGGYINCQETVRAAEEGGLSVCDYVEKLWGQQGQTRDTISKIMERLPATGFETVCEIGPGTGRYLELLLREYFKASPSQYEFYETAQDWADWLPQKYHITRREADGKKLSQTKDHSMDFVHAHGVFVYTPMLTTCSYIQEMGRVVKPGGVIAFDFYGEDCFPDQVLKKWLDSDHQYPVLFSEKMADDLLRNAGGNRVDSFFSKHGMGFSKYLIYQVNE
jgi:SAM-dependent methyltransferase